MLGSKRHVRKFNYISRFSDQLSTHSIGDGEFAANYLKKKAEKEDTITQNISFKSYRNKEKARLSRPGNSAFIPLFFIVFLLILAFSFFVN